MAPMRSEAHPGESTPFLGTSRHDYEENKAAASSRNTKMITVGSLIAIGFNVAILAFLVAETLLQIHGRNNFDFYDWAIDEFRVPIIVTSFSSIVFGVVNFVQAKHKRRPLPMIVNAIILGILTYFVLRAVGCLINERFEDGPDYCREPDHIHYPYPGYDEDLGCPCAPNYPSHPSRPTPVNLEEEIFEDRLHPLPPFYDDAQNVLSEESKEECQKWALKMRIITQTLIYLTSVYGLALLALFITVLTQAIQLTTRFFESNEAASRLRSGGISVEFNIRWGLPQQDYARRQPTETTE